MSRKKFFKSAPTWWSVASFSGPAGKCITLGGVYQKQTLQCSGWEKGGHNVTFMKINAKKKWKKKTGVTHSKKGL